MAIDQITTGIIKDDAVTGAKIATGTVVATDIAADAVDGTKLADNAVDSEHITAAGIDTAHLGNLQVTAAKVAADVATTAGAQTLTNKTLTAPVMTAPVLGTPASGVVTNLSGVLPVGVTGGSGLTTLTANTMSVTGGYFFSGVQVFDGSGTWTKPTGVTAVYVIVTGAGGGGGSAGGGDRGGPGGGAGGTTQKWIKEFVDATCDFSASAQIVDMDSTTNVSPGMSVNYVKFLRKVLCLF